MTFDVLAGIAFAIALLGLYLWGATHHKETSLRATGKMTFFIALIIGIVFAIV